MLCPRCGGAGPDDARFCSKCGVDLSGSGSREGRKVVSILFCDQVGSTARVEGAQDTLATGDVVNTAARLQSAAPPGCVIVGEETYQLTKSAFRYDPLEPIDAKGKREVVRAWLVVEPIRMASAPQTSRTPLVGRGREMLLIETRWE